MPAKRRKTRRPAKRYRTGYGRPPKRYQWKKGQSGNPAGRPKGSRNKVGHTMSLETLVKLVDSPRTPAAVRLRASKIYLELMMRAAGLWE